ncbi:MAG TPA: HAD family hydrolase [Pirellulales bacterium]|nr:HAD family hydrolase [Pirellulales bacterium]
MPVIRSAFETCSGAALPASPSVGSSPCGEFAPGAARHAVGLVFDLDDVLYDATLWRRWLLRLVASLGVRASYASFYRLWDREYLVDVHCARREYDEAFQSFLLASNLSWAQIDEVEAASRIQRENLELNVRPLPGVVKTIARLVDLGLPLVALADAPYPAARLSQRLDRLGLANRFKTVLSSFDLEAAKPSAPCYQAALDALGLPAQDVTYVGHDAEDLEGAKAIGMRTVAFNYQRHARADFYLTRFEDLPAMFENGSALGANRASPAAEGNRHHDAASPIHHEIASSPKIPVRSVFPVRP